MLLAAGQSEYAVGLGVLFDEVVLVGVVVAVDIIVWLEVAEELREDPGLLDIGRAVGELFSKC